MEQNPPKLVITFLLKDIAVISGFGQKVSNILFCLFNENIENKISNVNNNAKDELQFYIEAEVVFIMKVIIPEIDKLIERHDEHVQEWLRRKSNFEILFKLTSSKVGPRSENWEEFCSYVKSCVQLISPAK